MSQFLYFLAHNSTKFVAMMLKITEILGIIEWMIKTQKTPSFCIIRPNFDCFLWKMAIFHKNAFFSKTAVFLLLHRKCSFWAEIWTQCAEIRGGQNFDFRFVSLFRHYCATLVNYCAIVAKKAKRSKKSKFRLLTFVRLSFLHIVSKFQLKSCILCGEIRKRLFLRKMHFCEKLPFFTKNGQNFGRYCKNVVFFGFSSFTQ